jgi:hypothetical protein
LKTDLEVGVTIDLTKAPFGTVSVFGLARPSTERVCSTTLRKALEDSSWDTVGVSENIIAASYQALLDSIEYKLLKTQGCEKNTKEKTSAKATT